MLSEIAFEQIEGNYWYAAYGPFRVVMMKDTGYINATKMCSSGDKEYRDWSKNNTSKELIEALENKLALENTHDSSENSDLTLADGNVRIITLPSPPYKIVHNLNQTDVERVISGTYCHPLLIPHIACWVSPDFALMVSEVVNGYITMQYKAHLASAKKSLIQKQQDLVATEQAFTITQGQLVTTTQQNRNLSQVIVNKNKALNLNNIANRLMTKQVDKARERFKQWSLSNGFTLIKKNANHAYPYYAVRCQNHTMQSTLKRLQTQHPHMQVIFQTQHVPNGVNL